MGLLFADAWAFLTIPLTATIVHGAAVWIWHWPALFEAALVTPAIHRLQHVSFIVTAVLFWWALLQGRARLSGYGPAIFYLFVTALHTGSLGVLLALARRPLYPVQTEHAALWDLTPLEDQQLAGIGSGSRPRRPAVMESWMARIRFDVVARRTLLVLAIVAGSIAGLLRRQAVKREIQSELTAGPSSDSRSGTFKLLAVLGALVVISIATAAGWQLRLDVDQRV